MTYNLLTFGKVISHKLMDTQTCPKCRLKKERHGLVKVWQCTNEVLNKNIRHRPLT